MTDGAADGWVLGRVTRGMAARFAWAGVPQAWIRGLLLSSAGHPDMTEGTSESPGTARRCTGYSGIAETPKVPRLCKGAVGAPKTVNDLSRPVETLPEQHFQNTPSWQGCLRVEQRRRGRPLASCQPHLLNQAQNPRGKHFTGVWQYPSAAFADPVSLSTG